MNYKIYAIGNYLRIQNVETGEIYNGLLKEVFVDKNNLNNNLYKIQNVKDWSERTALNLNQIKKEDGSDYTLSEWETFYSENTGNFNSGGSSSLTTDEEDAIQGANTPSASNVFATMADVGSGGSITDVTLGTAINGFTADTPVDADTIAFSDLSDSNKAKKVSYAGLKSFFKSYFDTIYATISALSNYVPTTRTINGLDLTANRTLTTANVADSTDKRYQTENQKNFNDATSSIQTQLNAKVDKTTWTDYSATSVIVGFSAFTIKQIWYKIVENTMFVYFRFQGTSNSVDLTFTTPSYNAFTDNVFQTVGYTVNNTVNTAIGSMAIIASTNVVILKPAKFDTSWTSSGTKAACGMLTFKI